MDVLRHTFFSVSGKSARLMAIGLIFSGDIHKAEIWTDEEGLRVVGVVRLRNRPHHLQFGQQTVSVRVLGHGQDLAQIHRVQRASREQNQFRYHRGKPSLITTFGSRCNRSFG